MHPPGAISIGTNVVAIHPIVIVHTVGLTILVIPYIHVVKTVLVGTVCHMHQMYDMRMAGAGEGTQRAHTQRILALPIAVKI